MVATRHPRTRRPGGLPGHACARLIDRRHLPGDLPVAACIDDLDAALARHGSAVLVAPPGAGKTTFVPLMLVDADWLAGRRIVMLEPRRLAARAAARRLAALIGEQPGGTVGYQTRDERHISAATRIEVVTEGILTRRLQSEPDLPGVGLVVFDEVHERNLPTDLGLALTLDARRTLVPDLRVLAMSATAEADRFAHVLGDAPIVRSEGRQYPVDVRYAPATASASAPRGRGNVRGGRGGRAGRPVPGRPPRVEEPIADLVVRALSEEIGDILVFLPGLGEIMRVQRLLEPRVGDDVDVRPLAGAVSLAEQDAALAPSPSGRRRVVLATDIAETSLTVEGVRVVIDSGLARVPRHDTRSGMTRLVTVATSRASADQRAGRAGRTEPGVAYRLWSRLEHASRREHLEPEITQVDLAGLVLELAAWGTPAGDLTWLDPPPDGALAQGRDLLTLLGALDDDARLTPSGRDMLRLALHPRLAHMVAAAPAEHRGLACVAAALVDERDVLRPRRGAETSALPVDLSLRVELVIGATVDDRADRHAIERARERARDIARRAGYRLDLDDVDPSHVGMLLLLAYPDRLAMRRQPGQLQLRTGHAAWISRDDNLAHEPFVVVADLDGNRTNARVRLAAAITPDEVIDVLGDQIVTTSSIVWDRDRGDLVERVERRLDRMTIESSAGRPRPGPEATAALIERVRGSGLVALPWHETVQQLRDRVRFLAARHPEEGWPDWSDTALLSTLDEWLEPYLVGCTTLADMAGIDLGLVLRSQLPWPLGADLDTRAPAQFDLPTGRRAPISYDAHEPPSVAVRVQQVFGLTEHPRVDGVPLVLHLLSPADRPIQVTSDLPGFWSGSWAEVRKEMAGRYPKHAWPVDPRRP